MLLTVPVNRSFHRQVILHEDLKVVSFVNFDQGARLLAVDKVDISGKTIYRFSAFLTHYPEDSCVNKQSNAHIPGALVPLWRVKL